MHQTMTLANQVSALTSVGGLRVNNMDFNTAADDTSSTNSPVRQKYCPSDSSEEEVLPEGNSGGGGADKLGVAAAGLDEDRQSLEGGGQQFMTVAEVTEPEQEIPLSPESRQMFPAVNISATSTSVTPRNPREHQGIQEPQNIASQDDRNMEILRHILIPEQRISPPSHLNDLDKLRQHARVPRAKKHHETKSEQEPSHVTKNEVGVDENVKPFVNVYENVVPRSAELRTELERRLEPRGKKGGKLRKSSNNPHHNDETCV